MSRLNSSLEQAALRYPITRRVASSKSNAHRSASMAMGVAPLGLLVIPIRWARRDQADLVGFFSRGHCTARSTPSTRMQHRIYVSS